MDIYKEIDTRGLNCPLPILKAKKALADMASGQLRLPSRRAMSWWSSRRWVRNTSTFCAGVEYQISRKPFQIKRWQLLF